MEKRHDISRKASPILRETEEYFMPGSLPVQPQVTTGSGLVDLSCDSGWDGASRCRTTVGLDEHRSVVRGTLRKTVSRSSVSQIPCSARNPTEEIESCGEKCTNLCRVYKLIMISHVPGHECFEYLVPGLSFESHHRDTYN